MGYRIAISMEAEPGAEARLWALVSQRHIDVISASFNKNRLEHRIDATLEVELDLVHVRRLMRQLGRHHDIQHMTLDSSRTGDLAQGPIHCGPKRVTIPSKKGACLL